MNTTFVQASCIEGRKVDLRQSRVVATYAPDIVLFESSVKRGRPDLVFNAYPPHKKPRKAFLALRNGLVRAARQFPYARSDVATWDAIDSVWKAGKNVLVFNVDAPEDLRREHYIKFGSTPFATATRRWQFWAYLYLRDRYMADYTAMILKDHRRGGSKTIAVFLQRIHWQHVQFLLKNPSPKSTWRYYFGRFPNLTSGKILAGLKIESPIFLKYWKRIAHDIHP